MHDVLKVHADCSMKLKLAKCQFFQAEVDYLGHRVSEKGILMIPSYIKKVLTITGNSSPGMPC